MDDQLWLMRIGGEAPDPALFSTPELVADLVRNKPRGGYFWTSTLDAAGSDWLRWCMVESYGDPRDQPGQRFFVLRPRPDAQVYVIDGLDALRRLADLFPTLGANLFDREERGVGWNAALRHFDGIRLTEEGERATRWDSGDLIDLYGWDCESTVWGSWAFESVREIDGAPLIAAAEEIPELAVRVV